ncbi:MAG TPA: hypothetical protein O0X42_00660, partial [Methanocorpusculum sp.]|nr:hypothetical protein [Methanocorpusculum sp.]
MPDTTQESDLTPQEQKERKKAIIIIGILACIILLGVAVIAVIYVNTTVPVTIIADYEDSFGSGVIQLETVRQLDDKTFYAVSNALLYPYDAEPAVSLSADACSCLFVSRNTSNGNQTIMGRNMDYDVTNKPAWVFYVDSGGKYASFNMGY